MKTNNKNNIPFDLIAKFFANECNNKERNELEKWKNTDPENLKEFKKLKNTWDNVNSLEYEPDIENALLHVTNKLKSSGIKSGFLQNTWLRIAAVLILSLGVYGILNKTVRNSKSIEIFIAENDPIQSISFEDGSEITLNKGSRLIYPKKFSDEERRIVFEGEAYFKISEDKNRVFIVESKSTITRVLGTEFNLLAKSQDSIVKISVTEGLVSFNLKQKEEIKEVMVAAGYMGEVDLRKGQINSRINNDLNFLAWKTGRLTFKDHAFGDAINIISSYYEKQFSFGDSLLVNEPFTLNFYNQTLDEVITALELAMNVDIEMQDDQYIIKEKL